MNNLKDFISKIDDANFIDLYFVGCRPANGVVSIESIIFHDKDDAQLQCDYLNKKYNTTMYFVFKSIMHI